MLKWLCVGVMNTYDLPLFNLYTGCHGATTGAR